MSIRASAHLDRRMTVNQIIRLEPSTAEVFSRFGIDGCCGGMVSVELAAERDGVDPDALWEAVVASLSQTT